MADYDKPFESGRTVQRPFLRLSRADRLGTCYEHNALPARR